MTYKEAVETMIRVYGVADDLDDFTYRALAEEYDIDITD